MATEIQYNEKMNLNPLIIDTNQTNHYNNQQFNNNNEQNEQNEEENEPINERYQLADVHLPKRSQINIEFQNIRYSVRRFSFLERKFVTKELLHGIDGMFCSGELTAIMGPSGSGKTTLLNVMSGFKATGVTGVIQVNGEKQSTNTEKYRQLSCYIHQEDMLRPALTVLEIMIIAANLKLGYHVTSEYKYNLVKKILLLLGLEKRMNTLTGKLSGGQQKRLAISLELICNPSVIYLDEPTTGLDSSSSIQCIALLKRLAQQGHTVVCTIHQPSALMFELFDKLYTVVDGNCIYQGSVKELLPFLSANQLYCPSYHNPADFLMEVAVGDYERDLNRLINAANKKYFEDSDMHQLENVNNHLINSINNQTSNHLSDKNDKEITNLYKNSTNNKEIFEMNNYIEKASLMMQFLILFKRVLVCNCRNRFFIMARMLSHLGIGTVFGYLYLNVGPSASTVLGNYVYLYGTFLLLVYTGKMAVVLSFPLEMKILSREHFNRWYKLGPYFLSILSFEIPFQGLCVCLYIIISYYLTGNNSSEDFRFYYFLMFGIMASLSAQAWGFFVGATLPIKLAVFAGPILAVLFSIFGFCTRYIDITPMLRWMWHISYFRAGFHGSLNAIYGMNRTYLHCPNDMMYCHFKDPKVFLRQMMITDVNSYDCIGLMSTVIIIMHFLTIITLWYKLTKR